MLNHVQGIAVRKKILAICLSFKHVFMISQRDFVKKIPNRSERKDKFQAEKL